MKNLIGNSNFPNALTLLRILLIPAFIILFYLPWRWGHLCAASIFAFAAVTDWIDGYLARSLKQVTRFGTFLDPVADKLVIVTALVLVVGEFGKIYVTLPAAVIVGREIVVSALREWMAEMGKRTSVAVSMVAKFKTFLQMVALAFLLVFDQASSIWYRYLGMILLYIAAGLTLWSMIMYLKIALPDLTFPQEKE
jgi:CDP-diacylglycerol--glycerol-3-phosphate 3-phosphatidyltransferase